MLSDVLWRLSADVGLDKSLAVSTDAVLAAGSGEDKGGDLYGDGEDSVSSCCCGGTATTERFADLGMTERECNMISRSIPAQRQLSSYSVSSSLSAITLVEPTQYPFNSQEKHVTSLGSLRIL